MSVGSFDWEALIRAFAISLGACLIGGAIGFFAMRGRRDWDRWKPVLIMGCVGVALILTVTVFYAWPNLITVPALSGLSQAEAEGLLVKRGLIPEARPQYAAAVEAGRVIPYSSQNPAAGLRVKAGTVVSFAVSVRKEPASTSPSDTVPGAPTISIFQPKSRDRVACLRDGDNIYRCSVTGLSSGLSSGGFSLLLWFRPVNPPSDMPGWYLQRPPVNGISRIEADGAWSGIAQVGNALWPPHEDDTFDIAVSVADKETADQLLNEKGVVVRDKPIGIRADISVGVIVTLKR